ncbi:MAG: mutY [Hydrocarboniphaga sp.]|nr:A/G-specific adenine glycosylase [Hydrocarboniphaga sp.]MDB5972093.1 mutY [Hydrocarboniphaga sp.]
MSRPKSPTALKPSPLPGEGGATAPGEGASFASRLLTWFDTHGRHDLPWQHPREPYRVWLSEVMLQQTQVTTVIPYFERFLARFPDVQTLAAAPIDDVLQRWAGLGYYARARNLHRCAQAVVELRGGEWPRDIEQMIALPGVGRSTAAAILSQAFGDRHAILDGNVKRLLSRHAAVAGWPGLPAVQQRLWNYAEKLLPDARLADYTQACMDLGSQVCVSRRPLCAVCPVAGDCGARLQDRVAELPASKPKRDRPQRSAWLLLIENDKAALLLERRPPSGIWGGLWCPPVIAAEQDWRAELAARYGLRAESVQALEPVEHSFTHYDLSLQPLRLRVAPAGVAEAGATAWTTMSDPSTLPGLPAPVRKILDAAYFAPQKAQQSLWPEPSTA